MSFPPPVCLPACLQSEYFYPSALSIRPSTCQERRWRLEAEAALGGGGKDALVQRSIDVRQPMAILAALALA